MLVVNCLIAAVITRLQPFKNGVIDVFFLIIGCNKLRKDRAMIQIVSYSAFMCRPLKFFISKAEQTS